MKWVSVTLSLVSVGVQISNLCVATLMNSRSRRLATLRPEENKLPVTHLKMQVAGEKKAPPVIDVVFKTGVKDGVEGFEIMEGVYASTGAPAEEAAEPAPPPPG